MADYGNDLFEEDPFVDDSFVDDSPVDKSPVDDSPVYESPYKYSTDERQALRRGKDNYSNIIDKYICLSHGLPSPGFTARHASKIVIVKQPVKRKCSINESPKVESYEKITSEVSLKNDSDVECEDPIQEEIEKTLRKRKRELGLSDDYVLKELELNDEIEVSNIGLEEDFNENDGIVLKKSARLEDKSRFEKRKNVRNEGNWEKLNRVKVKRTPGRSQKSAVQGELQGKETNRRLKESTVLGTSKKETKSPGRPKKILPKKSPGRPKMFPKKTPERPKKLLKMKSPGRPKKLLEKKSPIRPKKLLEKRTPGRPKKLLEKKSPVRLKKFPKKNSPGGPKKSPIPEIGKEEGKTEAKETHGRARKISISKIGKQEAETKAKKTRGRSKTSTYSKIYKDKRKELSDETRENIGKPGPSSVFEMNEPEKIQYSRGRPKLIESGKVGRPKRPLNKLKNKSFDNNRKPVLHNSILRYFKYLSTNFGISKEQGHLALSKSLDLTVVKPLKEGCCPDIKSFCPPNEVFYVIPFVSETSVLEKDKGLDVQTNAEYVKISKRDGTWKETSTSAIDFLSNDRLSKETQNKEKTKDRSKLKSHCCRLSSKIHSGKVENLVSCKQVLEKSQTEGGRGDLHSVGDCESQLQDKEPQDHENTDSYKQCSIKEKGSDTKLVESENVFDLNQNSRSEKDGNQIECRIVEVQLDKIDGEPIKRRLRNAHKSRQILPVENLVDEINNEKGPNLQSAQAMSHLTVPAKKNQATERYPSLEYDSEGKCKEEEHSSTSVRQGRRPRKFSKETQIKSRKRKKVETSAPCPSPSSVGSIKSKNSVSQRRVKKSLEELPTFQDDRDFINSSLSEVFTFSDDEENCENLCSADEKNHEDSCSADQKTCRKSLDPLLKDCQPPSTERDMPKSTKGNVASDYIETDKDIEINIDYDDCSRNLNPKGKKSFDNGDGSPEVNTEVESNSTVAPPYSENDSIKKSLKKLTTSVCEKYSNDESEIGDFQVLKANHEESVVSGIDVVKKKRISLAPRSKETFHSDLYISSIMPAEETQPSGMNLRTAELVNGVLSPVPAGVDMPEVSVEGPKNKGMSRLDTTERKKVGSNNEDSDDDVQLNLIPVVRYPGAVGSWHASLYTVRKWTKLLQAERSQYSKKPEPPRPEINTSKAVDTTEISTMGGSKARSFFDLSDDEDLSLPTGGEEDPVESLPVKSKRMSLSRKFGVSLLRKSSQKVPKNRSRYNGKAVDVMKYYLY